MANKVVRKVRTAVTKYAKEFRMSRKNKGQRTMIARNIKSARSMSNQRGTKPLREALGY